MTTPAATPISVPATPATNSVQGRFLWYELMTSDSIAAQRFYPAVFGWGTETFPEPIGAEPYVCFTTNGRQMSGIVVITPEQRARGVRPHWLSYIGADDVDATTTMAQSLGATILVEPTDIPTVGRIAVLTDPQGADFGLYRPTSEPDRPDAEARIGEIGWHELMTTDFHAAFDFYRALFGWELGSDMDVGGGMLYRLYRRNGRDLGGMFNRMPGMEQIPPNFGLYVRVDDVNDAVEMVKLNGGQIANGPMEVPGGTWIANCIDPQGVVISVMGERKQR